MYWLHVIRSKYLGHRSGTTTTFDEKNSKSYPFIEISHRSRTIRLPFWRVVFEQNSHFFERKSCDVLIFTNIRSKLGRSFANDSITLQKIHHKWNIAYFFGEKISDKKSESEKLIKINYRSRTIWTHNCWIVLEQTAHLFGEKNLASCYLYFSSH